AAGRRPQGGRLDAPGPPGRRQGARSRRRDPALHRVHPRLHREQGQDEAHPRRDRRGHLAVRHADLRPVALPALQEGSDHAGRGAAPRDESGRVQAQDRGHPLDGRDGRGGHGSDTEVRDGRRSACARLAVRVLEELESRSVKRFEGEGGREGRPQAYEEGVRLLAPRALSVHEVRVRLARRGYSHEEVRSAVEELTSRGFLDDRTLAYNVATTLAERRLYGRPRVAAELARRGVAAEAIGEALERAFAGLDEDAMARKAAGRHAGAAPIDQRGPGGDGRALRS